MSNKQLSIRLYGKPVGILEQEDTGKLSFQYRPDAEQALSLNLPIQERPYDNEQCEAYFGGLLPEGEPARVTLGKRFGISPRNTFSLLKAIGYDCAGAVSCHGLDEPVIETDALPLRGKVLSESALAGHIRELPRKPLFIGVEGIRLSLAGAQDKAAVCLINGEVAIPIEGSPTTHILKPAIDYIEGSVQNEYLCLRLAGRMKLPVPQVEIRQAEGIPFLLIERYDRQLREDGYLHRIHQEDFCQALSILSTHKYQSEGGPGFKECFNLLKRTSQPAKDRTQLAEALVFNFLTGNTDAHGKNFSLLHRKQQQISMTPLYDLMCTQVYPDVSRRMAMKIGSKYKADEVLPRHWEHLCEEIGFSFPVLKKIITRYADQLPGFLQQERKLLAQTVFSHTVSDKVQEYVDRLCEKTGNRATWA